MREAVEIQFVSNLAISLWAAMACITTACILQTASYWPCQGKLRLDADIRKYTHWL